MISSKALLYLFGAAIAIILATEVSSAVQASFARVNGVFEQVNNQSSDWGVDTPE